MAPNVIRIGIVICSVLLLTQNITWGHPGGLDSSGCHHNRKTGDYHCHGGGSSSDTGSRASGYSGYNENSSRRGSLEVTPAPPQLAKNDDVKVVGITDGDTIKVLIEGQQVQVRLYGIDAPERGQAFGSQAQTALKQITAGRKVTIKTIDTDRYKRPVALIYADGAIVNEILVASGYAWVYPQYCKQSFCSDWKQKEATARVNKNGLWQETNPVPPWELRRNK